MCVGHFKHNMFKLSSWYPEPAPSSLYTPHLIRQQYLSSNYIQNPTSPHLCCCHPGPRDHHPSHLDYRTAPCTASLPLPLLPLPFVQFTAARVILLPCKSGHVLPLLQPSKASQLRRMPHPSISLLTPIHPQL